MVCVIIFRVSHDRDGACHWYLWAESPHTPCNCSVREQEGPEI